MTNLNINVSGFDMYSMESQIQDMANSYVEDASEHLKSLWVEEINRQSPNPFYAQSHGIYSSIRKQTNGATANLSARIPAGGLRWGRTPVSRNVTTPVPHSYSAPAKPPLGRSVPRTIEDSDGQLVDIFTEVFGSGKAYVHRNNKR